MIWQILPHTTLCIASDRLILLDIRQDRYLRVPSVIAPAMRAWLEGAATPAPRDVLRMLTDNRVARSGDPAPSNTARDVVRIPTELIPPIWKIADAPRQVASVVVAQLATRLRQRTQSLASLLRDHIHMRTARRPIDRTRIEARCATFARSRIFSPLPRNCLLDTLSLDRWLGDDARDCRIVFGVTAHPFTAHCWLQSSHVVLNDSYDHVARHTPILAL